MKKKSLLIIVAIALALLLASCSPYPRNGVLKVPSWLQGVWYQASTPTLSINASSSNIILKMGSTSVNLGDQAKLVRLQESSTSNTYQLAQPQSNSSYRFELMPNGGLSLTITTAGMSTSYTYYK